MRLPVDLRLAWSVVALLGILLSSACEGASADPEQGSETHFLRRCDDSVCGDGFVCRCGACTRVCESSAACTALAPEAACVPAAPRIANGSCSDTDTTAFCDVGCLSDGECAGLGELARCERGFCRVAQSSAPSPEQPSVCEPENIPPEEVVILGDAVLELSGFATELAGVAREAGWLGEDEQYRNYASPTTSFLAEVYLGEVPSYIETQYAASREAGPARVVILNGGATDMLQNPCPDALSPECPEVRAAALGAERLFARMADDGVRHVLYLSYPDPRENPSLKAGLDVLRPLLENACGKSPVACHFLDLRPLFREHAEYLGRDGIVFSQAGARATAIALWGVLDVRCVPR